LSSDKGRRIALTQGGRGRNPEHIEVREQTKKTEVGWRKEKIKSDYSRLRCRIENIIVIVEIHPGRALDMLMLRMLLRMMRMMRMLYR